MKHGLQLEVHRATKCQRKHLVSQSRELHIVLAERVRAGAASGPSADWVDFWTFHFSEKGSPCTCFLFRFPLRLCQKKMFYALKACYTITLQSAPTLRAPLSASNALKQMLLELQPELSHVGWEILVTGLAFEVLPSRSVSSPREGLTLRWNVLLPPSVWKRRGRAG